MTLELGPIEHHPFKPFLPKKVEKVIIGSFPPGKFTDKSRFGERNKQDINFYYGSSTNLMWRLLEGCYGVRLENKSQILEFLRDKRIGMANVIKSCRRFRGRATDCDLHEIVFDTSLEDVLLQRGVQEIYFTSVQVQRWYNSKIAKEKSMKAALLYSSSTQGARAVGRDSLFQELKRKNPNFNTVDFRLLQYKEYFN